jgi:hypothetical protein
MKMKTQEILLGLIVAVIVLIVICFMSLVITDLKERSSYRMSLLGKQAIVNESMTTVVIMDYDYDSKVVKCRLDQGPNASPRFQEVKFLINELTVQTK